MDKHSQKSKHHSLMTLKNHSYFQNHVSYNNKAFWNNNEQHMSLSMNEEF
jgi:hypothetical protein